MPERCGWQFSIVVKEFDLQEPDLSEARLKLPFKWMYECCTLTLSGLANVCSWMLLVYIENALSALGQTQNAHGQIQNQPQQQSP